MEFVLAQLLEWLFKGEESGGISLQVADRFLQGALSIYGICVGTTASMLIENRVTRLLFYQKLERCYWELLS